MSEQKIFNNKLRKNWERK